jgi:hypothetical protein
MKRETRDALPIDNTSKCAIIVDEDVVEREVIMNEDRGHWLLL